MPFLRRYNTLTVTGTTAIRVPIVKRGVVDFAIGADWTPAAGDVKILVDGTAAANVTNLPTAIAGANTGAVWEFILTAAELSCKQCEIVISDAATKAIEDQCFSVETFGNASAMYQADLSLPNLPANVTQLLGTAWLTPGTAGTPDVNTKLINAVATTSVTTINANQGTTQPINFTGTAGSALAKSDMVDVAGAAVSTSSAQIGVNAVNLGGTAQTGRDIGASVLLSTGTGTGQLDFTSGVVKANLAQILGTALTETAGLLAGGFKKFFNIATPAATMDHGVLVDTVTTATTATNLTNAATAGDLTATMKTSVTTAATAATPTAASVTGAVGSVTGNIGGNLGGTLTSTERNAISDALLARSLVAESYAADGAVPTLSQALYALLAITSEFSITGTTITCKKLDGSTTAMTFTLDSATVPTSRTRAT